MFYHAYLVTEGTYQVVSGEDRWWSIEKSSLGYVNYRTQGHLYMQGHLPYWNSMFVN